MEMLQGVWKQHLRPRAVVGYGVKIFLPSPPNYVTRSPGEADACCMLYYNEPLEATHRRDLIINGLEAIWLQVKFPNTSALFSVMYRPPDDNDFFRLIEQSLEKA